ncbi:MAG: Oligopeptide/dipeptide ABC transporter, ATPase subunit [Acetothermia bacterium 64_32]|nr:MAG: Oligopeptide/dipeptide ABC transporter, ATPase subunit [Acetothermia bacterium 64_32]HAF70812.1 ABC transporter ATP-binding protein [Candidatus Acetothermia bacterium]
MSEALLSVQDLVVEFEVRDGNLRSVDHVSLDVPKETFMGLIGESGCGKTTIVQAILNLMPENGYIRAGRIYFDGTEILSLPPEKLRRIRWEKIAMVFQAAQNSLNPVMRISEHMIDTVLAHRRESRARILERASRLLELVSLDPDRVLVSYPHELSGGMKQRVIIALSLLLEPEMLILDEPTTALDLISQAYLMEMLQEIHHELGITMLMVTHDVSNVAKVAERVAVMYAAKILEVGSTEDVFYRARHPYTAGLINAIPSIVGDLSSKRPIPGLPPSLITPPPGCRFHPRCPLATQICREEEPRMEEVGAGHSVACHHWKKTGEK